MATIARAESVSVADPAYQAYEILHLGFTVAPILFGLDKFFNLMVDWEKYVAPWVVRIIGNAHRFMLGVGLIEIVAGLVVAFKPRWGAYIVALWLLGIIFNLLTYSGFYDIALRDFGLLLRWRWGVCPSVTAGRRAAFLLDQRRFPGGYGALEDLT